MEAGEELTYDYGAIGSAGGTTAQDREDNTSPQQQPIRQKPRTRGRAEGDPRGSSRGQGTLQAQKKGDQGEAGASGSLNGSGESGNVHELSLRRPCLCGSRRCRGFLPYNRAIL